MPAKSIESPLQEITLRRYEAPHGLSKRELVAKLCLSLGVLQPGDSRDVVIDVLYVLLVAAKQRKELTSIEVRNHVVALRTELNIPIHGTADSNIRRQLKRLREIHLVEKIKNNYRILEFMSVHDIVEQKIEQFIIPQILQRIKEYGVKLAQEFPTQNTQQ